MISRHITAYLKQKRAIASEYEFDENCEAYSAENKEKYRSRIGKVIAYVLKTERKMNT
jgi:hypothetical protein